MSKPSGQRSSRSYLAASKLPVTRAGQALVIFFTGGFMRLLFCFALSLLFLSSLYEQPAYAGPLLEMAEEHPEIFEGSFTPVETPCNNGSSIKDCFAYSLTELGFSAAASASVAALVFTLLYAAIGYGLYWSFKHRKIIRERSQNIYKSKFFRAICIFFLAWSPLIFFISDSLEMFLTLLFLPLALTLSAKLLYKWYKLGQ